MYPLKRKPPENHPGQDYVSLNIPDFMYCIARVAKRNIALALIKLLKKKKTFCRHLNACLTPSNDGCLADRLAGMINESTSSGNSFVKKRKVEEDSKRLSVGFNLPPDFQNEFSEGNTEKWATTLPNPILTPEKSPVMETVSSGTLNSVSDLPLSESEPILSPGSDSQRDSKPFSYVANEEPKFDLRPSSDQPLSPNLAQMSSVNPLHRVSETLSIDALLSRTGSDPSSSNPSRPSSGVELWMPRSDFPIVKMIETVSQLQTQLTRLMVSWCGCAGCVHEVKNGWTLFCSAFASIYDAAIFRRFAIRKTLKRR